MKFLALALFPTASLAQTCAPHADAIANLSARYGEVRQSVSMDLNGNLIEVFANEASGSWTLTRTTPDMIACLLFAGGNYEATPAPKGEEG